MRKKGFTLIELLVVITIIAMLLAILMPALSKVKALAQRLICATNIKGLGTAMFVYGHDYDGSFPVQGGRGNHEWTGHTSDWEDPAKDWSEDGNISIGASLFLLIREVDVPTGSFICKSGGQREYEGENPDDWEIVEVWDFGNWNWDDKTGPRNCLSYAYQMPYEVPIDSGNPTFPPSGEMFGSFGVLADKNPWYDPKIPNVGADYDSKAYLDYVWTINQFDDPWDDVTPKMHLYVGNAEAHGREGQNVLFADGSARFERRPDVGVENDNIYTNATPTGSDGQPTVNDKRRGEAKFAIGSGRPRSDNDSFLVNDDER